MIPDAKMQAKLDAYEMRLAEEGFTDLDTLVSRFRQTLIDANEHDMEQDREIESLQARLEAALQDLDDLRKLSGHVCFACKHAAGHNSALCLRCRFDGGRRWRWKGLGGYEV